MAAQEIVLAAPLTTIVDGWQRAPGGEAVIRAVIEVPSDAPADLGVGAWVGDAHGRWFQRARQGALTPGRHVLSFSVDATAPLRLEPLSESARWNGAEAANASQGGLFFWSASASRARLRVTLLPSAPAPGPLPWAARLLDLRLDDAPTTGERWSVRVTPSPYPANPFDAGEFRLDLVVRDPTGAELRFPGFHEQPMRSIDRGDREDALLDGPAHFSARWRPRIPGRHQMRLEARWRTGRSLTTPLPEVEVSGAPRDAIVRPDANDPRFLSVDGAFVWPLGPNLRSIWDLRCSERLGTQLTIDRGTFSYDAYLTRAAAGGADACEIWLSSWNLALEWNPHWEGFHGVGRFNVGNAWRLDRILDRAEELGIRVNLVISNHGQGSENTDREWENNPWNRRLGGPLSSASQLFNDPRAQEGQMDLRRYLVARYSDSPAILAWKLWSEINLTAGSREDLRTWHADAASHLAEIDPWRHPVTTHWSGDFRNVDPGIAALPGIGMVCIDAYHATPDEGGMDLHQLFGLGLSSTTGRSLSRFGKPVLITEYGGNWSACPPPQMDAEFRSGPWLALVNGYAGGPMLWWFEWIDQGDRWPQYGACRRFLVGEDLRGTSARSLPLATPGSPQLGATCWSRPGRRLGYVIDRSWGATGLPIRQHTGVRVDQGEQVPPGPLELEWWDADRGAVVQRRSWDHPGGPLSLEAPPFTSHIAFKLWRRDAQTPAQTPANPGETPIQDPGQAP